MNIQKIFIAHSWIDVGLNIQTKAVAKRLSQSKEVLFITQARIGQPQTEISDTLKVVEWPDKRPNKLKDLFFLIKKIRKDKPGALIVHFGATNISMLGAWLCGVKYRICWMHTLTGQYFLDTSDEAAKRAIFYRKIFYRMATHVIVQNEFGRNDAHKVFKINSKKIFKIYNGIVPSNNIVASAGTQKSIRYSGRLDYSKGIDILIKAFSLVYQKDKTVKLEIAGKGGKETELKALVKSLQLEEVVIFHGYFDHYTKALQFIAEAYCLAVPSRLDNFPTVILEALSFGVPVIASAAGGITDMIENERDGYLVEKENIEALAIAIAKLTNDIVRRDLFSVQAKKTFEEKFTMERHVENVEKFLDGLN